MYKIGIYIPEMHLESVKQALFDAGAGKIGQYEHCAWQVKGKGQFKPMQSSQPFIGTQGELEFVEEFRVELVCDAACIQDAIKALKAAHPYETPAYDVVQLVEV